MTAVIRSRFTRSVARILKRDPACSGGVSAATLDALVAQAIDGVAVALRNAALETVAGWLDQEQKAHVQDGEPAEADKCASLSARIRSLKRARP